MRKGFTAFAHSPRHPASAPQRAASATKYLNPTPDLNRPVMKTFIPYSLLAALAASGLALGAETAYTTPVGYVSQTCLSNSDTLVGTPLRPATIAAAGLTS